MPFNITELKKHYVVYLTMYMGNLLPKWYIGHTNIERFKSGYNGSVSSRKWKKLYEQEQLNNKHLFRSRILSYHQTKNDAIKEELRVQMIHEARDNDLYFNEAYAYGHGFINGQRDKLGVYRNNSKSRLKTILKQRSDGMTIAKESGLKMSETRKNKRNENGLNDYEIMSLNQSVIMNKTHNGMKESVRRAKKAKETKRANGINYNGSKNPNAKKINIYDSDGNLFVECNGNFKNICIDMGLPFKALRISYINNGNKIYSNKKPINKKYSNYVGWYAVEINSNGI